MPNLLTNPNLPLHAPWANLAGLGSGVEAFALAPDGTMTAFQLTDLDGTNVTSWGESVAIAADTGARVFYAWVRKGATTNYPLLDVRYGTDPLASDKYAAICIDPLLGVATPRSGWAPDAYGVIDFNATFWVAWLSLANNGYTKITAVLSPAFNGNGGNSPNVGTSGSAVFWTPYLTDGSIPAIAPVANFTYTPSKGVLPTVTFTDTSTNSPSSWLWVFGDGTISTLQNPTHTFPAGVWSVSLTVTNGGGTNTKTVLNAVISTLVPAGTAKLVETVSARLFGASAGVRCGASGGLGTVYAFISPVSRTVVIVDYTTLGSPVLTGYINLPLSPYAIAVDTSTGLTLYVTGSKTLWVVTLDGSHVPTLTATHDMPMLGLGGVDVYDVPAGTYEGSVGPLVKNGPTAHTDTYYYLHDRERQLLYVYSRSNTAPFLTLVDQIETPGCRDSRYLRLGAIAAGATAVLEIVTPEAVYQYDISVAGTATLHATITASGVAITDHISAHDSVAAVDRAHIAATPYLEAQTGAPTVLPEGEDFVGSFSNGAGLVILSANASLGKITAWQGQ